MFMGPNLASASRVQGMEILGTVQSPRKRVLFQRRLLLV